MRREFAPDHSLPPPPDPPFSAHGRRGAVPPPLVPWDRRTLAADLSRSRAEAPLSVMTRRRPPGERLRDSTGFRLSRWSPGRRPLAALALTADADAMDVVMLDLQLDSWAVVSASVSAHEQRPSPTEQMRLELNELVMT